MVQYFANGPIVMVPGQSSLNVTASFALLKIESLSTLCIQLSFYLHPLLNFMAQVNKSKCAMIVLVAPSTPAYRNCALSLGERRHQMKAKDVIR